MGFLSNNSHQIQEIYSYLYWRQRVPIDENNYTPGYLFSEDLPANQFLNNLTNKTFLDIGSNDGFFSFLAEKNNAKSVDSIDIYHNLNDPHMTTGWNIEAINLLKKYKNSSINIHNLDVLELEKLNNNWDVVLCSDVLIWVSNFELAINKICTHCNETLIIRDAFYNDNSTAKKIATPNKKYAFEFNIKYLEQELLKHGFKITKIIAEYPFIGHQKQQQHFPKIGQENAINIYKNPFSNEIITRKKLTNKIATDFVNSFIFVYGEGWVITSDAQLINRFSDNTFKKIIRNIIPNSILHKRYNHTQSSTRTYTIIAKKC